MIKKLLLFLLFLLFTIPLGVVIFFIKEYGDETQKLINYKPRLTTQIYDKHGDKISNIFLKEHRYYATINEIPPHLIEALLAIEDTSFFEHPGINVDAIFRAIIKDIKAQKIVEGASTLTQQLVKNTLLTREKKISRKLKEVIYSLKIEMELTKEEILERYLNEVYLGHGYYGVKTASEGYFRKPLDELTLKEMAILVGLPKAPSFYAPTKNYELCMGRANRVINRMYILGWIDKKDYESALAEKPEVFNDTLSQNRAPYIADEVLRQLPNLFEENLDDIRSGGYKIYTTIDLKLQKAAREGVTYAHNLAVKRASRGTDLNASQIKNLNGALVSINPKNGHILALVGGVNYKQSSYNRATQGQRQPGSAFKPFIYQVALDLGYSPVSQLVDMARTYKYKRAGKAMTWQPKNYEKDYEGLMTLREALIHSRNLATINLVTEIGLSQMLGELSSYGIKNLPKNLSLSLGSISLSPLKLAQYYTSFASGGIQSEPLLITKIEQGSSIWEFDNRKRYITSPEQSYLMTTILHDVVEHGTGRKVRVKGIELAGKTGTTNKSIDAWFAGYSPSIETIVWFGNDDNTPMRKFETGGRVAGPAFRYYYKQVLKIYPQVQRHFKKPEGVTEVIINGKKEYFTEVSKPPSTTQNRDDEADDKLIF